MSTLYDVKLQNGELLQGVYFIQYQKPIRVGKGNSIVMWANDSIRCFDKVGNELKNFNFIGALITKIYDQETGIDLTETYSWFVGAQEGLYRGNPMYDRNPFVREVVRVEE